jgi:hypothetical protein
MGDMRGEVDGGHGSHQGCWDGHDWLLCWLVFVVMW